GSYGLDAPHALGAVAVVIAACLVMAITAAITSGRVGPFLPVLFMLTIAAFTFHTTLRGKFVVWAELLDELGLRGDERVLDLGCGRGAVLLPAAQHLTTGRAVGGDLRRSAEFRGARQREAQLVKVGMGEVRCRALGWRCWCGGPWAASRLVTATKPERRI